MDYSSDYPMEYPMDYPMDYSSDYTRESSTNYPWTRQKNNIRVYIIKIFVFTITFGCLFRAHSFILVLLSKLYKLMKIPTAWFSSVKKFAYDFCGLLCIVTLTNKLKRKQTAANTKRTKKICHTLTPRQLLDFLIYLAKLLRDGL